MSEPIRIGARGSPLALAQTEEVVARLRSMHPRALTKAVVIRTHGDEDPRTDLETMLDGKRAFTKRIEEALLAGRIDAALHSLKDVPTDPVAGLVVAAIPPRADPRDAVVTDSGVPLGGLPAGARVGTSSIRRRAQLLARWPHLSVIELHGNVGTRIARLAAGDFDAVVLAAAGIQRLRLDGARAVPIDPDLVTPAPGQGALAVEVREDDARMRDLFSTIDDAPARTSTTTERLLAARVGGGCNVPLGVLATIAGSSMALRAAVASPDGRRVVRTTVDGPASDWEALVDATLRRLRDGGAARILEEAV